MSSKKLANDILLAGSLLLLNEVAFSVNVSDAELELYMLSDYNACESASGELTHLQLCIGGDHNCYPIPCPAQGVLPVASHDADEFDGGVTNDETDDHPFVNHADEWDFVYIRNDSGSGFNLWAMVLWLRIGPWNVLSPPPGGSSSEFDEYVLARVPLQNPPVYFEPGEKVPIFKYMEKEREKQVATVFCGANPTSGPTCVEDLTSDAWKSNGGLESGFDKKLPWSVRQATKDVWQSGIMQYRPWARLDSRQNGCDEAFNFYASQFTNNIHFGCRDDDNTCSYFRYWETRDKYMRFEIDQMAWAGRLYKVDFKEERALLGSCVKERTYIKRLCRCLPNDTSACYRTGCRVQYTPKVGDYLIRVKPSSVHIMTLLGNLKFDNRDHLNSTLAAPVIHKDRIVWANDLLTDANERISAPDCTYKHEFYIGEVDHEIDPDGSGPVTSGALIPDNGANSGFRATLISIY